MAAGFDEEDYEDEHGPVEVWPEIVSVVNVFIAMDTQWRVGMNGATGLDYTALPVVLRMTEIPRKKWPDAFADIRVMERAALNEIHGIREDE